ITTGDVLLTFDTDAVSFRPEGLTGVGCYSDSEIAANHGVFCPDGNGSVRLFLQKPDSTEQKERGALSPRGQALLDIGIMNMDAKTAVALLEMCGTGCDTEGRLNWTGLIGRRIEEKGLDFYSDICCAMGLDINYETYRKFTRKMPSQTPDPVTEHLFAHLSPIPFSVSRISRCGFLHFGTLEQLIHTGSNLMTMDLGFSLFNAPLRINNHVVGAGSVQGSNAWIEGCRISAPVSFSGGNVLVGLDIEEPLECPDGFCCDVSSGVDREGQNIHFIRIYGVRDLFNREDIGTETFCNRPLGEWMRSMGLQDKDVWDPSLPEDGRTLWNGRFFPVEIDPKAFKRWLPIYRPEKADAGLKDKWKNHPRLSFQEILDQADSSSFFIRRERLRAMDLEGTLSRLFQRSSGFSAKELGFILTVLEPEERNKWLISLLRSIFKERPENSASGFDNLEHARLLHTLGSALTSEEPGYILPENLPCDVASLLSEEEMGALYSRDIPDFSLPLAQWTDRLKETAFSLLSRTIVVSRMDTSPPPANSLRSDEIIWSRSPVRLDLGGGWSDTPPYSLENGGCVINAAVDLNGQAPIQVYARVIEEKEIRINSIDHSSREVIRDLDALTDYREPTSQFGLAKAALTLSGFSLRTSTWPTNVRDLKGMLDVFGGGIELTTLAAIPSGSGLGTSSIMGAVLLSAISRMIGRPLSRRELFFRVLQLEQELTTGGGWQDQIGGVVDGVKMITSEAGLVPDPRIHYVPPDVLDPRINGGLTLLYYTGLRRLAKNILKDVVGGYLDRDRRSAAVLRELHAFPPKMAEAMGAKDMEEFGRLIDRAWRLNKALDPDSTTDAIEDILQAVKPHILGAKLLGAGGGGFLLIVCRSLDDARSVRQKLMHNPPNTRARFFDFSVSSEGLVVTVC
ncbi:MAG: hypothetical protein KKB53_12145, partial [Acidobacteria bacterium]|nr:hypothetical protein [Acidobacteriota bacterium]